MGISNRIGGSLHMSDDLWVNRWLLERICENHNYQYHYIQNQKREIGMKLDVILIFLQKK